VSASTPGKPDLLVEKNQNFEIRSQNSEAAESDLALTSVF
jgi:hypothetical protein